MRLQIVTLPRSKTTLYSWYMSDSSPFTHPSLYPDRKRRHPHLSCASWTVIFDWTQFRGQLHFKSPIPSAQRWSSFSRALVFSLRSDVSSVDPCPASCSLSSPFDFICFLLLEAFGCKPWIPPKHHASPRKPAWVTHAIKLHRSTTTLVHQAHEDAISTYTPTGNGVMQVGCRPIVAVRGRPISTDSSTLSMHH
jgi:hypothetical protein